MIIGIEYCSDSRDRNPTFKKLRTQEQASRWILNAPKGYAYPGAADPALPMTQQNFHQRLRYALVMPPGFRLKRKEVDKEYSAPFSRWYHKTEAECKEAVYRRHAVREI